MINLCFSLHSPLIVCVKIMKMNVMLVRKIICHAGTILFVRFFHVVQIFCYCDSSSINVKGNCQKQLPEVFYKKYVFLKNSQSSRENTCARFSCNFIKKETLAQVFSCDFCDISRNTFFCRTPLVTGFNFFESQSGKRTSSS